MLKKILQKVIGKEELSADDFKNLQTELDKLGKDNPEVAKLKEELANAKKQLDDIETAKLSDLEKAQKQIEDLQKNIADRDGTIAALTQERDGANASLAKFKRDNSIKSIAKKHGFDDDAYLDMLLKNGEIDIDKEDAVNSFMENLKKAKPKFFNVSDGVKSGTPPAPAPQKKDTVDKKNPVDNLIDLLNNAPAQNI